MIFTNIHVYLEHIQGIGFIIAHMSAWSFLTTLNYNFTKIEYFIQNLNAEGELITINTIYSYMR